MGLKAVLDGISVAFDRARQQGVTGEVRPVEHDLTGFTETEIRSMKYTSLSADIFTARTKVLMDEAIANPTVRKSPERRTARRNFYYVGDLNQPGPSAAYLIGEALKAVEKPKVRIEKSSLMKRKIF